MCRPPVPSNTEAQAASVGCDSRLHPPPAQPFSDLPSLPESKEQRLVVVMGEEPPARCPSQMDKEAVMIPWEAAPLEPCDEGEGEDVESGSCESSCSDYDDEYGGEGTEEVRAGGRWLVMMEG